MIYPGWVLGSDASNWRMLTCFLLFLHQFHRWCLPSIPEFQSAGPNGEQFNECLNYKQLKNKDVQRKHIQKMFFWNEISSQSMVWLHLISKNLSGDCIIKTVIVHIFLTFCWNFSKPKLSAWNLAAKKQLWQNPWLPVLSGTVGQRPFPGARLWLDVTEKSWKLMFLVHGVHTHLYIYIYIIYRKYTVDRVKKHIIYCKRSVYIHIICI